MGEELGDTSGRAVPELSSRLPSIREVEPLSFVFTKPEALPPKLCAEIIRRFESHEGEQYPGRVGQTAQQAFDVKRSTDLVVSGKPHWKDVDRALFASLASAIKEFRQPFPYFNRPFKDMGYAVQRTQPGEYDRWHIDGGSHEFSQRQLVAVWYLNDVPGPGGETEFLYQAIRIRPETGKLLLFPPFWTHEHRGNTLTTGVKYIATPASRSKCPKALFEPHLSCPIEVS